MQQVGGGVDAVKKGCGFRGTLHNNINIFTLFYRSKKKKNPPKKIYIQGFDHTIYHTALNC